jgi:hypothetical protein
MRRILQHSKFPFTFAAIAVATGLAVANRLSYINPKLLALLSYFFLPIAIFSILVFSEDLIRIMREKKTRL